MRILLATGIYPPESGGPATYTRGLALAFRERGHDVSVIAYGDRPGRSTEDGFPVWRISRRGGSVIRYLRYAWRVFFAVRKADLVYAQGPVSEGLPATIGARLAGRPVVMKVVGDYAWEMAMQASRKSKVESRKLLDEFIQSRHGGLEGLYERIERWTVRHALRVIVPSRYLKSVVERWGIAPEKIDVVVNAVEPLPSTQGREVERRSLGVEGRVVVLSAVRAVPWKGIAELITWWKDVPTTHLLVVAGDGPELENWKTLAAVEGVADRIRFLGRVNRQTLARWYEAADAFVLHSGYEGYPHVVAEAALRGLPCLVSDRGGNPETVEDFPGLVQVVPYQNREAWAQSLSRIEHRASSIEYREGGWTHEKMVEATEKLLSETFDPARGKMQTVMVSYDRELLYPQSTSYARVSSLADARHAVKIVVLDGRVIRSIREGIRFAKQLPGRTIVTAQDPFVAGLVGYIVSRWTNRPLEIQEHGDFFSGEWKRERWLNRPFSLFGRWLLRRAERVRVVSERVKSHLVAIGVKAEKIEVIPVAQDLSSLLALPLRPITTDRPVQVVVPCRFVAQKGLDVLLNAASKLHSRGKLTPWRFIGEGPLRAWLEQEIARRGLGDRITIEPWQRVERLWDNADLFILSSRYEGWGRTIVEAMAAGVPVITTDVGCVGSFVRPGTDALVVPVNDAAALAEAIRSLADDPERRSLFRATARNRVQEFPSQETLHANQRHGWRSLLTVKRDVGPRWDLWVAGFLLFAIVSRAVSVILFHESLAKREWGFYYLVDHWFQGYGYSYAKELGCASAYRSPGYLFFLTGLYAFFTPTNTWAQAIVQNLFVVGVLWLVYAVGKRLVGKRAALIGGLLMAAYPYTFYHYTQYYHTFLSSFFLLLLVWFLLHLAEAKRWRYAFGTGASIAALAYVQGTILVATPFLVLWLLWKWWPDWKRTVIAAAIMAVVSAGLIAPWTYRNWKELRAFVPLTTDLGHGLFKANNEVIYALTERGYPQEYVDVITVSSTNPDYKQYRMPSELEEQLRRDGDFRDSIAWTGWHPKEPNGDVATCAELGPLDEVGFNRHWTGKAKDWIRENWWSEGWKLQLLKLKTFWQPALFPSVKTGAPWSFAGNPVQVWMARNAVTLASAVVIFGGWIGMLFAVRRRDKNVWLPLVIMIVYSALHTFFAGYTKYRIPLDNLLAMYAGWTMVTWWDRLRK